MLESSEQPPVCRVSSTKALASRVPHDETQSGHRTLAAVAVFALASAVLRRLLASSALMPDKRGIYSALLRPYPTPHQPASLSGSECL